MKNLVVIFLLSIVIRGEGFSQEVEIIDPIQNNCYQLNPSERIKPFNNSTYKGKIIVETSIDTTSNKFSKFDVVFASLKSKKDPKDTIVLTRNSKSGTVGYLEEILPAIVNHLNYLELVKTEDKECIKATRYYIPITIE